MNKLSRLWRLAPTLLLPVALCPAQEDVVAQPEEVAAERSAAEMTIPKLLELAENVRGQGRMDDAIRALNFILQRAPSNVDALRLLGDIAWESQDAEEARTRWLAVRQVQPNDFGANWGLGRLHLDSGVPRNAIHYLEIALRVVPVDPPELETEVLLELARAYASYGNRRSATETVQKVLALDPDNYDATYVLVVLRTEMAVSDEDLDQALGDAERLVQIVRNDLEARGTTREGVQRLATAYQLELQVLSAFTQVLFEQGPDGAYTPQLLPGREKRAAEVVTKTVDIMLRQADLQRTLAYFQIAEIAAKAVEYDGGTNPRTLMDLGLLQKVTGQSAQAIETFGKVLERDPLNKEARRQLDALRAEQPAPGAAWPGFVTP